MIDYAEVERALTGEGFLPAEGAERTDASLIAAGRKWLLRDAPKYKTAWSNGRVRIALDQLIMTKAGIDVGGVDGVEGVMTQYGWEQFQNKQRRGPPSGGLPRTSPAFCKQSDAAKFYGPPGTNHATITPPYRLFYGDSPVRSITINAKCAQSALRAMQAILDYYGAYGIQTLGLNRYGGCYNNRVMRGGTRISMHAYACAIDWDPARNPLRADHRTAVFARPEYAAFLDAWEAEGWTSLGRARDFDWMHVQAADL